MKTIIAAMVILSFVGCGPSNLELIKASYIKGEIDETQFVTLYNAEVERENQKKENAAILGAALLGYSADIQNQSQAQQSAYRQEFYHLQQQQYNQQMLLEMQKFNRRIGAY